MTLPRENRLVRFYVQLAETGTRDDNFDRSAVTPEAIIDRAQSIMKPYKLDFKICDWFSVYTVRQHLVNTGVVR